MRQFHLIGTDVRCVLQFIRISQLKVRLEEDAPYVRTSQSYIPPVQKICLIREITLIKNLCALCAFAWDKKIISHTESTKFTECLHPHGARVKQIAILCAKKLRVDPRNPWRHIINMISQMKQIPCGVHFIRVIRVISVQKKEIYLRFIDLRELSLHVSRVSQEKLDFQLYYTKKFPTTRNVGNLSHNYKC